MTSKKKRSNEFRRHRQVLTALYISAASAGFLLLTASVAKQLFFHKPTVQLSSSSIVADNPGPGELLECHDLVLEQLTQLNTKTTELFARPLTAAGTDEAASRSPSQRSASWKSDWKAFSTKWRDRWDHIDARCRFTELAETNLGAAYDQMAQVHEALPAMRLKYNRLIADFDKEQADELRQMRQMLNDSRDIFMRQIEPGTATEAPSSGSSGSSTEEALP